MPYEIIGNCVHKKGDKKPLKCYSKHADALAYLRALEANVDDAKEMTESAEKVMRKLDQREVAYTPVSVVAGKACSSCMWWREYGCHIVTNEPELIVPNGYCNRHEVATPLAPADIAPIPVVIVEPMMDMMDMEDSAEMALSVPKTIFERVKDFAATLLPRATPEPEAFEVFKTANGRNGWIARHTGKWIDRENEILSEHSHEEYVERVQKGVTPLPELWMWHAKGTKHGQAQAVWKSGGFVLAIGTFDGSAEGKRAFEYYQKHSGKIKLSHMFHYPRETKVDGVYHAYNTIEITTLPNGAEAFPYTSFEEIQTMALPKEAESMIEEALGTEALQRAREADKKALDDTKALDALGVASKGYDQYDGAGLVPAEKVTALETAQTSTEARLKAAEELLAKLNDMPATITALNQSVKSLTDQLETELKAKADLLAKVNELESKQALLTDLKPPASQSSETLLNDRDKSFIDTVMAEAKNSDQPSLIEKLLGVQPTIHS